MAEGPGLTEPYGKTFNILVTTTERMLEEAEILAFGTAVKYV